MPASLSNSDKPATVVYQEQQSERERQSALARKELEAQVRSYLEDRDSPLAEVVPYILSKKHWQLLIGISAIESQFCTRKLYLNCWGIGGDYAYRHYASLEEGIDDTDALIARWQAKGKWMTPEQMNCSYVVPCNPNWVKAVKSTISELNAIVSRTVGTGALDDTRTSPSH